MLKLQMLISVMVLFFPMNCLMSQNVGIDVINPSEKLQVRGVMHTTQGGVRYPDGTLQTTAAFNSSSIGEVPEYAVKFYFTYDNGSTPSSYSDWVQLYDMGFRQEKITLNNPICLQDFNITKTADQQSVDLYKINRTNDTMLDAIIHVTRTINGAELPAIIFSIDLLKISSITKSVVSVGSGKYKLIELIDLLSSGTVTMTYNEYDGQGNLIFTATEDICN
jgi:type VI protein secretion system component Hcp